jgi:integrase
MDARLKEIEAFVPGELLELNRSRKLDHEMVADLLRWSSEAPYAGEQDWIFASGRMKGRQPLWPEAIMRNYIRPAALRAEIAKPITGHVFRHILHSARGER